MRKIIFFCCIIFLISCRKVVTTPVATTSNADVFSVTNNTVTNGQTIQFTLDASGKYYLKIYDTTNNQVITKEKFLGVSGNNIKKIFTSTLPSKTLYLYLTDSVGNQIKKTKITIN